MNTSPQLENSVNSFVYERALPISNAKLGMWLFISTEVMLFTALIASYIVLRFSSESGWPSPEQVGINPLLGLVNTIVLLLSGLSMWQSVKQCENNQATRSRFWLLVTFCLGLSFLGIKTYEYKLKFDHGIFPSSKRSLIYDRADDNYLSRAVMEIRDEIRRIEQLATVDGPEVKEQRLKDLYLLQSGIVDWTQFVVGRTGEPEIKKLATEALANQIYPIAENPAVSRYIDGEQARINKEKSRLAGKLDELNSERRTAQERLRELLPKKDSGDQETLRDYDRISADVSRLTVDISELNKEIRPIDDRLQAMERVDAESGINESYDVRLPIVIPGGHKWASLYYLLTGAHAIHLIAGLLPMLFLLFSSLRNSWLSFLENLGLYWHFVDVVWLVVFAVIYLT